MWQLLGQDLDYDQPIYKPTHSPKYILALITSNWMFLNVASSGVIWTLVAFLATFCNDKLLLFTKLFVLMAFRFPAAEICMYYIMCKN